MIPQKLRLPRSEFAARGYKIIKTPWFSLKTKENNLDYARFGVVIGTAVEKRAVKRNFWKRQARTVFAERARAGKDYILLFLKRIKELNKNQFRAELSKVL
ncbi:MAG: ribonuclease P protein component [Patescibacteria group bacterium]|nr:ribonuclease P protein component [Patescibacteria group bacterium]